jgi:hypothetical protein
MENKTINHDFKLTIQSGGIIEFEKTGVITQYLAFNSQKLRRTWRLKLKEDTQSGVLKVNGQVAFQYFFTPSGCKIQTVTDGIVEDEWEIEEILMELRD